MSADKLTNPQRGLDALRAQVTRVVVDINRLGRVISAHDEINSAMVAAELLAYARALCTALAGRRQEPS